MTTKYINKDTANLSYVNWKNKKVKKQLLWGDSVEVLSISGDTANVKARGVEGTINSDVLGDTPLLEVYFIDVGQGDGVLIVTPERKHILIDGGYNRVKQPTRKNAADFVDWKFAKDYGKNVIKLDAMIASHCDADHYGGLWDLLSTTKEAREELDTKKTTVKTLYHAGISWWKDPVSKRWLGPIEEIDNEEYLTRLLGDKTDVEKSLNGNAATPQLQGEWGNFMQTALDNGCDIQRVSNIKSENGYLPGFSPKPNKASLKVLAPFEKSPNSTTSMVKAYGKTASQNTNGHSLLLRLDYGKTRILLTGDLNKKSMQSILADIENKLELQCDVAKGCHHGSDDISYEFLQAMNASATVISSGDNEGHTHPRPNVVAASAQTGHVTIEKDELKTPLVYSTEISRSLSIGKLTKITASNYETENGKIDIELNPQDKAKLNIEVTNAGDLNPSKLTKIFNNGTMVVNTVIYGLVNVRTDGSKILCATLNEKKDKWEIEKFKSRF